jgi:dihydrolipoamide dehydrogenase
VKTRDVEVAVIGAGTAGLNARREAEKADKDWVLIESGPYGTTCARVGCMPSKLLIAAAESAHSIEAADTFGIDVDPDGWEVDGPSVMERVRRERDRFAGFVVDSTESLPEERRIRGHAQFIGPETLRIDDDLEVRADTIIIATGSSPWIPPQLESIEDEVLTNADIFEMETLPDSMAVFGTGVVALELGQALDRLGVDVHFFNPFDEVGIFTDPAIQEDAREEFSEHLQLHVPVEVDAVERHGSGYRLRWQDEQGGDRTLDVASVFAAAGRRPNVQGLNLEATGLQLDDRGVPAFDPQTMQCGDAPIFIAGDAAGHRPVLHEASDDGRIAGANAARYPDVQASVRREPLSIAFTDPQMAIAGEDYESIDADRLAVGEVSYENQGRARVMGINRGRVRVYGDKETCKFLGAEMFGPRVEHTAHLLSWAAQQDMSVQRMLEMPYYHPVVEEGIRTALRDLAKTLKVEGRCRPEDTSDCPGA